MSDRLVSRADSIHPLRMPLTKKAMFKSNWTIASRTIIGSGFGVMLYYAIFIQPNLDRPGDSWSFQLSLILIIAGVATTTLGITNEDERKNRGHRLAALGWAVGASGIVLEAIPSLSKAMIVVGFLIFGIAVIYLFPTFTK